MCALCRPSSCNVFKLAHSFICFSLPCRDAELYSIKVCTHVQSCLTMLRQLKAEDCVAYAPVGKCPGNVTQYRAIPSCSISRVLHWLQHVLETAKVLEIAKREVFFSRRLSHACCGMSQVSGSTLNTWLLYVAGHVSAGVFETEADSFCSATCRRHAVACRMLVAQY